MKEEQKNKIQEIMAGMKCPYEFNCVKHDYKELCKAEDSSTEGIVKCIDPVQCIFKLKFESSSGNKLRFCGCPLRVYLHKQDLDKTLLPLK